MLLLIRIESRLITNTMRIISESPMSSRGEPRCSQCFGDLE